jgi:hypothetical protein
MDSNKSGKFYVTLQNNTDLNMKDLKVYFERIPNGVTIETITVASLPAGQKVELSGTINAGSVSGDYNMGIVASGSGNLNKKPFHLVVRDPNASLKGLKIGLFGFVLDFSDIGGIALLAIILIIIIALVIMIVGALVYPREKEVWMEDYYQ